MFSVKIVTTCIFLFMTSFGICDKKIRCVQAGIENSSLSWPFLLSCGVFIDDMTVHCSCVYLLLYIYQYRLFLALQMSDFS